MAKHGALPKDGGAAKGGRPAESAQGGQKLHGVQGRAEPVALDLDRVIHERLRLGIVSALAGSESLTFNELKELLGTTDGNLSVHARKLEDAGYVACTKSFEGRVPRTEFRLTSEGRAALRRYVDHMEALIQMAKGK
ncbi:MAG: winged helix-turn-helix domain-containing protein [Gemmatimonadaceae bacterium]